MWPEPSGNGLSDKQRLMLGKCWAMGHCPEHSSVLEGFDMKEWALDISPGHLDGGKEGEHPLWTGLGPLHMVHLGLSTISCFRVDHLHVTDQDTEVQGN